MSDELTIVNSVGPSDGHSSLNSFAGKGSRMQVVGFEDETILDNISREIFSKAFRAETYWESAAGNVLTKFDEEARDDELILILISSILLQKKSKKSFALKGAQLTNCGF